MTTPALLEAALLAMLLIPLGLVACLGIPVLLSRPLSEVVVGTLTRVAMLALLVATVVALFTYLAVDEGPQVVSFGRWFSVAERGFEFDFLIDGASLVFTLLAHGTCGVVVTFSYRYMHQEPGYTRYFILFATFVAGITFVALAGSIEVLFAGWELLGLSSALLVAFFQDRRGPVVNALRVFAVYRASDAAMLSAAVLLHHWAGSGSLGLLFGQSEATISAERATAIALLLLVAVAAKSALLPFSGWLPRAMEGPTPTSAVYYGALSIHAGCFLLLRAEPLLVQSPVARVLAVLAGASTALYATITARVQTDVKSALSFAALTQVGIIVVEIALGLTTLALLHMVGHACYRLLQFLTAPNILHDLHQLDDALGEEAAAPALPTAGSGQRTRRWLYLLALERGFVDALIDRLVIAPFGAIIQRLDRIDRALCGGDHADDDKRRTPR